MKKEILLVFTLTILFAIGSTTKIFANEPADITIIKGILRDSISNESEPYATIKITKANNKDKAVGMAVTDDNGLFSQKISGKGKFIITFSSVGKATISVPFTAKGEKEIDLGTIYTKDDVTQLKGVEVVAQKLLVTMDVDKMNYNMADDPDSKTSNVLDMLRKVPMITVDGSDNITVNGNSNFKVYVDGKPNAMISANPSTILKYMPATSVTKVEVVTNPGAKYDAEGVGGVLNLITSKVAGAQNISDGYNGTARATASTKGYGGGLFGSVQKGKLSLTVNGNMNHSSGTDVSTTGERIQISDKGNSSNLVVSDTDMKIDMLMGNMDASYEINKLNMISASFGVMGFNSKTNNNGVTSMSGTSYGGNEMSYISYINQKNKRYSITGSVDFQHNFASNKNSILTLSYQLNTTPMKNDSYSTFDNSSLTGLKFDDRYSHGDEKTTEHTFQTDFTTTFQKTNNLSAGVKLILRNNSSDNKYYIDKNGEYQFINNSSMNYKHSSDILAAYAEYSGKSGKLGYKAGLRYEYTFQSVKYLTGQGGDFDIDYGNLVPSADLSYAINQQQNIGLTYNMRISRPGITYLNPYVNRQDPMVINYGNSNLECEKAHNISMVYNYYTTGIMMNLTLRYSLCNNGIDSYSFYDNNNVMNTTYGNISKNNSLGLTAFINWNPGKNTRIYTNSSVTYVDMRSDKLGVSNSGWQDNVMVGFQQTLPYNYRLSLNLMSSSRSYSLEGWRTGFSMAMGSVSKTFLNDKLSLSLSCMTPLSGGKMEMKSYTKGADFINNNISKIAISNISFSISYSLSNNSSKVKKTKRTINNSDLKERTSDTESIGNIINQ